MSQSVILEKEKDITSDPRGVYLTGDAVRIFQNLGLGPHFLNIGHCKYIFAAKQYFTGPEL